MGNRRFDPSCDILRRPFAEGVWRSLLFPSCSRSLPVVALLAVIGFGPRYGGLLSFSSFNLLLRNHRSFIVFLTFPSPLQEFARVTWEPQSVATI